MKKEFTNLRSALVLAGASTPSYRRRREIPYNFSAVFQNKNIGPLFKLVILERLSRIMPKNTDVQDTLNDDQFYEICLKNNLHKAFNVSENFFRLWLEGSAYEDGNYIKKVEIHKFIILEDIKLDFECNGDISKEVYFLGENGDGKTLLLMALFFAFRKGFLDTLHDMDEIGKAFDIFNSDHKNLITGYNEYEQLFSTQQSNYLKSVYAYGPQRARYSSTEAVKYGFMSLFHSDCTLIDPTAWLTHIKAKGLSTTGAEEMSLLMTQLLSTIEAVISDLLTRQVTIEWEAATPIFKECDIKLNFDQLSEGYKSVILFTVDLIYRLYKMDEKKIDICQRSAVVLIDEIDLHIHPRWQLQLIPKLRSHFPNVQFFFTTHSPTIIQGASDDSLIYKVYRQEGKTTLSAPYFRRDLNHLMMNTLATSPIFGLESARMQPKTDNYTTADTYALSRLEQKLEQSLQSQYQNGKKFLTDEQIDELIDNILAQDD